MKARFNKYNLFAIFSALLLIGALWFSVGDVLAQNLNTGLEFAEETGLSNQDPRIAIARIIRIVLGFLGIIAVGIMIYAGFIWMTAKGEEEKINKAKKIMLSGGIGLIIILASFGIATFVMSRLSDATGGSGGSGGGGGGGGIGGGSDVFAVSGTTPANLAVNVPRNAVIRFRFTKAVKEVSVNEGSFAVNVAGTRSVSGNYIEFIPSANCEAPNESLKCFAANSTVTVQAASGILSIDDRTLNCSGSSLCNISFNVGEIVDTSAPRVNITNQQVCVSSDNTLRASSIDDWGVSFIDFFVDGNQVASAINNSVPFVGSPFNAEALWNANGYQTGQNVLLKATAYDLDSNQASSEKEVVVSASHCCNGVQDGDETGIDCGGSCLSCAAMARPSIDNVGPAGGFCSNDVNKFCRKATEVADCGANASCDLGTPNGATGNFVTITGSGFGTARGKVFFTNAGGTQVEAVLADDAATGNPSCTNSVWQDKQIIAVVPAGAEQGKISITTSDNKTDATDDDYGTLLNDFKKNTIQRPGICALTPVKGKLNDVVAYQGVKLSAAEAYYGNLSSNIKAPISSFNSEKEGTATVPNLASGLTTTFVLKSNVESNYIPFTKENEPYDGPIISSIEPSSGPIGQYVTIRGSGFGSSKSTSKVFFGDTGGREADYAFPDVCAESVWDDKQIVVKVPAGIADNTSYKLTIERAGFPTADSGTQMFEVTSGSPNPGICRLQPSLGQPNSEVIFWGEYFRDKDAASTIRFYNNVNQQGQAISFWQIDESASGIKPWKAITTVPQTAATGPVKLLVGTPAQSSNVLNFKVGQCSQDSDCGGGTATCCAAGLPEAGKCKATAGECYGSVATSVYEWRFSTGASASCAPDQQQCGTVCCAGACDETTPNKCAACLQGQNECGDGQCCNEDCEVPPGGGDSTCPDPTSCSGYSYNQCLEGFYCPNSPGLCSPYPGTNNPIEVGVCGNQACEDKPGCSGGACSYDSVLNRCVQNNTQSCRRLEMRDNANQIITANNQPVTGQCDIYNNNPRWHINNWVQSCPAGWTRLTNNRCVDNGSINGACTKCANPFSCQMAGNEGKCATNETICPSGSTCDPADNKCKKPDTGTCECCCKKSENITDPVSGQITNPGCCAGLSCDYTCGADISGTELGMCSGCVVNGIPDDALCNCANSTGKFCDNSENPRGVCNDCSAITDPAECSEHAECCVDGKNNNRCTSVPLEGSRFEQDNLQYCAYYNCTNVYPNTCNVTPVINGVYSKLNACQTGCTAAPITCGVNGQCDANSPCPNNMRCDPLSCECKSNNPGPGEACKDPLTQACTGTCAVGYQCLLPTGYGNGNGNGDGAAADNGPIIGNDETCRCCCKPPTNPGEPDTCKQINPGLNCIANQGDCTSATNERGLCCGCTSDGMCGDVLTTGCGLTGARCCQTRPIVTGHTPAANASGVCRNTSIEAVFNQTMDLTSFSSNTFLIADYGKTQCPSGYSPVASVRPSTRFASLMFSIKKIIAKVLPVMLTNQALADVSNFCYVPGSAIGYNLSGNQSKVTYRITRALDSNIRYYLILKGDPGLAEIGQGDPKDYYNANIANASKVGMIGAANGFVPDTFNNTTFKNAEIWSFTTGKDICSLDKVKVNPGFQLFQQSGQQGSLEAAALDRNSRPIQSIAGFYDWNWAWSSDDNDVAQVVQQGEMFQAAVTAGTQQDAQTLARAKATITVDRFNQPSTVGQSREGTAQLRLFLCENPWPVYYSQPPFPPGYNWPWKDGASGIEFYYCRDKSGIGTIDDLPALTDEPVTKEGGRKICMFGPKVGQTCSSDTNCNNVAGSCLPEVLKEFFFFREGEPGIPSIQGSADPLGTKVTLRWQPVVNANRYKIYYGLNPGQYVFTAEVPSGGAEISKTIEGLSNGLNYYFAVTALTAKNQESIFSNELKIKPADTTPPAIPELQVSSGDGKISLFWKKVPEATGYIAYIGVAPRGTGEYAVSTIVRLDPPTNTPNVIFTSAGSGGLNNNATYYVSVRSFDQFANLSDYAAEIAKKPNEPYLVSAASESNSVTLTWLPFISATGYTITYGQSPGSTDYTLDVSNTVFKSTISGLTNNTPYYFRVRAKKGGTALSEFSNERSATPGSNDQ